MSKYNVKCKSCFKIFSVEMFDDEQKNLFLVDKRDWYCDECKQTYFRKQTGDLTETHKSIGFPELEGSEKQISWAEKIRGEMIKKVGYLQESLKFESDDERELSRKVFESFNESWKSQTSAEWWIDKRKMTVRDISREIDDIMKSEGKASADS